MKFQAKITTAAECGIEVYRLLVWEAGKLVLVSTHLSKGGALERYRGFLRAKLPA